MALFIRELDFFEGSVRTIKHCFLPWPNEWLDELVNSASFVERELPGLFSVSSIALLMDKATMRSQARTKAKDD